VHKQRDRFAVAGDDDFLAGIEGARPSRYSRCVTHLCTTLRANIRATLSCLRLRSDCRPTLRHVLLPPPNARGKRRTVLSWKLTVERTDREERHQEFIDVAEKRCNTSLLLGSGQSMAGTTDLIEPAPYSIRGNVRNPASCKGRVTGFRPIHGRNDGPDDFDAMADSSASLGASVTLRSSDLMAANHARIVCAA